MYFPRASHNSNNKDVLFDLFEQSKKGKVDSRLLSEPVGMTQVSLFYVSTYFLILQNFIEPLDLFKLSKSYEFSSYQSLKYQVKQILQDCSYVDLLNFLPLRIGASTDLQEFPCQCFLLLGCRLIKLAISNQIMNGADLGQSFFCDV